MSKKFTKKMFEACFNQDDVSYVYYLDDYGIMHFLSDNLNAASTDWDGFTTKLQDAMVMTYDVADKLENVCNYVFPERSYGIVSLCSRIEWR